MKIKRLISTLIIALLLTQSIFFASAIPFTQVYEQSCNTTNSALDNPLPFEVAAIYEFQEGQLNQIRSPNTTYRFEYNKNQQISSAYIGENLFAKYTYDKNQLVSSIDFGNGQSISQTYDKSNRVTSITHNGAKAYEYEYTNGGEMGIEKDYVTSRISTYNDKYEVKDLKSGASLFTVDEMALNLHVFKLGKDKIIRRIQEEKDKSLLEFTFNNGQVISLHISFDNFGRKNQTRINYKDFQLCTNYEYSNDTSDYISSYKTTIDTGEIRSTNFEKYQYDRLGNITDTFYSKNESCEKSEKHYSYDEYQQLTNITDAEGTLTVNYDNAGNILHKDEYSSKGDKKSVEYSYSSVWKDQLKSINGITILYDEIGNPISFGDIRYSWNANRQLSSYTNGTLHVEYTYDELGHRTKKSIVDTDTKQTYEYFWLGDALIGMTVSDEITKEFDTIYFLYDLSGNVFGFIKNGKDPYLYQKSKNGTIAEIYNENGIVAKYEYDDFGNIVKIEEIDSTIKKFNPFYYRSYCLDRETNLYYLLSRYYVSDWGRFLSPDSYFSTGKNTYATNMYTYCENNPVNTSDPYGYWGKEDHRDWTKDFATQTDFGLTSANNFAEGNYSVDIEMSTNPLRAPTQWLYNQRYHFDRRNYCDNISNGEDTRLYYYNIYAQNAKSKKQQGQNAEAEDLYGKSLHFLQDITAHGNVGLNNRIAVHGFGFDEATYDWQNENRVSVTKVPSNTQLDGCPQGYGQRYNEMAVTTVFALIAYNMM